MASKRILFVALLAFVRLPESEADQYGPRVQATDPPKLQVSETRSKRAFASWDSPQTFAVWKPPTYQLNRPYFIPVYGAPGQMPLFFPPQQLNINPGAPLDNPLPIKPFRAPPYLPPRPTPAPTTSTATDIKINNRDGADDDDDDDRPVWGAPPPVVRPTASPARPTQGWGAPPLEMRPTASPTRPTRPPGVASFPPLVHDIQNTGFNKLNAGSSSSEEEEEEEELGFVVPVVSGTTTTTTTARPATQGPSDCVWAIVSCCSASTSRIPDSCFEQRGCPGPFWGSSPCESDFARSAIEEALNYYNQP